MWKRISLTRPYWPMGSWDKMEICASTRKLSHTRHSEEGEMPDKDKMVDGQASAPLAHHWTA